MAEFFMNRCNIPMRVIALTVSCDRFCCRLRFKSSTSSLSQVIRALASLAVRRVSDEATEDDLAICVVKIWVYVISAIASAAVSASNPPPVEYPPVPPPPTLHHPV